MGLRFGAYARSEATEGSKAPHKTEEDRQKASVERAFLRDAALADNKVFFLENGLQPLYKAVNGALGIHKSYPRIYYINNRAATKKVKTL